MVKPVTGTAAALISHHLFQFVIKIFLLASIKQIAIHKLANVISNVQVICVRMEYPGTLLIVAALMSVRVRIALSRPDQTVLVMSLMMNLSVQFVTHSFALMEHNGTTHYVVV
jgi:hypothetical protein